MESDSLIFLIICLFCVLFFGLGCVIGFLFNEYILNYDDYNDYPQHPEFYDSDGNFIDEELLYLHVENPEFYDDDEEDDDDDEDNWVRKT